jgi:hypothetical protein
MFLKHGHCCCSNPRELEDIPDHREIIEITFGDSMIKQVDNLEENVYIQDNTLDEDREDIIENQETETEKDKTQLYEMDALGFCSPLLFWFVWSPG